MGAMSFAPFAAFNSKEQTLMFDKSFKLTVAALVFALKCMDVQPGLARPHQIAEENTSVQTKLKGKNVVKLNDKAPDFALPAADGKAIKLSDYLGKKSVVVYFYPKDHTPGCTTEACTFRDSYAVFKDLGAEVIGISSDSIDSHKHFADDYKLPFVLLSDEGGKVRRAWGVPTTLGIVPGRVTYVIDRTGTVRLIFNSQMDAAKHVEEAKRILEQLEKEKLNKAEAKES
jgi:peroxiredoxin Q/BCP